MLPQRSWLPASSLHATSAKIPIFSQHHPVGRQPFASCTPESPGPGQPTYRTAAAAAAPAKPAPEPSPLPACLALSLAGGPKLSFPPTVSTLPIYPPTNAFLTSLVICFPNFKINYLLFCPRPTEEQSIQSSDRSTPNLLFCSFARSNSTGRNSIHRPTERNPHLACCSSSSPACLLALPSIQTAERAENEARITSARFWNYFLASSPAHTLPSSDAPRQPWIDVRQAVAMAIAMGWHKPDNVAGSSAPAIMVGLFVASGGVLFGYDTG